MIVVDKINRSGNLVNEFCRDGNIVNKAYKGNELVYQRAEDYINDEGGLQFEILTNGYINWTQDNPAIIKYIEYSINGDSWVTIPSSLSGTTIDVNAGDVVSFRGVNSTIYGSTFSGTTAQFNAKGNALSIVDKYHFNELTEVPERALCNLFRRCNTLIHTSGLTLPATTLSFACYQGMFIYCSNMVDSPVLPALTLAPYCYQGIFLGCTNLSYINCLATDISADYCTTVWVDGVETATGTFVKNANMNDWPEGVDGIPTGWTVVDAE